MLQIRWNSTRMYTITDTTLCIGTHMGDHCKHGWPSVQKAWCFRVHQAQEQGKQHTRKQLQTLIAAIAEELHVTDYNPQRNWFYQVLKRHKIQDKRSGDKRVRSPSADSEDLSSVSGQAATNGHVEEAKAKKNRGVAKASKLRFTKAPSSVAEPGLKRDYRIPQLSSYDPASESSTPTMNRSPAQNEHVLFLTDPISPAHLPTKSNHRRIKSPLPRAESSRRIWGTPSGGVRRELSSDSLTYFSYAYC